MKGGVLFSLCSSLLLLVAAGAHGGGFLHPTHHRFRRARPISEGPDVFFEVSMPSRGSPCSSVLVLQHAFAHTYSLPPAIANYTPPSECGTTWDQVILKWTGTCKGRQFDRIAALWFGGVEVLRTCTAEPTANGIYWEVQKDVTRFSSVFKTSQIVTLELANVVDSTYTGIFNINITLEFYKSKHHEPEAMSTMHQEHDVKVDVDQVRGRALNERRSDISLSSDHLPSDQNSVIFPTTGPADLVLPISNNDPLAQGYWFQIASENDTVSVTFIPPKNIYRTVLEVCVSFHGNDEFWYTNPPNEYLEANGLGGYPGNGPFRELQVYLDDIMVGTVWPFPVIFTGGINPLFWRPAAAIGAYNLPSYDIELTPFVGSLVDGKNHTISMRVEHADGSWPVDANLHLWLDPQLSVTMGGLLTYEAPSSSSHVSSDFEGLDGSFRVVAKRTISFSGYLISSLGNLVTTVSYSFGFDNVLIYQNASCVQIVTQEIQTKGEVVTKASSNVLFYQEMTSNYPLYLFCSDESAAHNKYTEECTLEHAFNQEISIISSPTYAFKSLKNSQAAEGSMTVVGNSVIAGEGALQQHYDFDSTLGCYHRFLSTRNYSVLLDVTDLSCESYQAQFAVM